MLSRFSVPVMMLILLVLIGCGKPPPAAPEARLRPKVRIASVEQRTITRVTGQPGFIEAYEQTAIYPKISGFVDQWIVDIGDPITAGKLLAHLDVPDVVAEHEEKQAEVELDKVRVQVAEEMVKVATENWKNAAAQVDAARANLGKYAAEVERWKADYVRINELFKKNAVEAPVNDESFKHWQSTLASQKAAEAEVVVAQATEAARKADVAKARADVEAARGQTKVAQGAEKRLAALVGYASVKAPYNGIVIARNVNTGDFVQPAGGDRTGSRSLQSSAQRASPMYIVARTDKVRIFVDVPEMEAASVAVGSRAWITIDALDSMDVAAAVTRTSWALNVKSRTLRAEIDIPNPHGRILPNMYAYGRVELKRGGVWAVPLEAIVELGNQTCCYELEGGKAKRLPIQRGIDDGKWVEVRRKRLKGEWVPFTGNEQIILGDLSQISNDEPVRVDESADKEK